MEEIKIQNNTPKTLHWTTVLFLIFNLPVIYSSWLYGDITGEAFLSDYFAGYFLLLSIIPMLIISIAYIVVTNKIIQSDEERFYNLKSSAIILLLTLGGTSMFSLWSQLPSYSILLVEGILVGMTLRPVALLFMFIGPILPFVVGLIEILPIRKEIKKFAGVNSKPRPVVVIITVMILLIVSGGAWYLLIGNKYYNHKRQESQVGVNILVEQNWKTYRNQKYMFEINYPSDFVYQENSDGGALVNFWYSQSPAGGVGTKIHIEHSKFSSFEDFVTDMKENYIYKLVKSNDKILSDQQAKEEVEKLGGQYSFEVKKVNNSDVLVHKRSFYGYIDGASESYIWIGNGDYLLIDGGGLDVNSFKFISP